MRPGRLSIALVLAVLAGSLHGEDKAASEKALAKALDDLESEVKGKKEDPVPSLELLVHFAGKIGLPTKDALALVREIRGHKIPPLVALAASLEREEETDPQKLAASLKKWAAGWKPRIAGETFYVSPDGDDKKGQGSLEAPWKTLEHAIKTAPDGSALVLRGGSYAGAVRCEKPLAFRAYPKETPRLVPPAGTVAVNGGFEITEKAAGSQVVGLEIDAPGLYVSAATDAKTSDVVIERCKIHGGLSIFGSSERCIVSHCEIDHATNAGFRGWKSKFLVLQDCHIHDVKRQGVVLGAGVLRSVVERNLIEDAGDGIELGDDTSDTAVTCESIDCVVRNNIIARTKAAGIMTRGALRARIENNTLLDVASEDEGGIYIRATGEWTAPAVKKPQKTKDAVVVNNVVVVASAHPAVLLMQDTEGTHLGNNCYWSAKGSPVFDDLGLEKELRDVTFEEWCAKVPGGDPGSLVKDPALRPDHAPGPSSPCLHAGQALTGFVDDLAGHRRKAWDMGALAEPAKK
jgi:hypothetical protein